MVKVRRKKSKYYSAHSEHRSPLASKFNQATDTSDLPVSENAYTKDEGTPVPIKQKSSRSSLLTPPPHLHATHPDSLDKPSSEVAIPSFFSCEKKEKFSCISGTVGKIVELEYPQPKPLSSSSRETSPVARQQHLVVEPESITERSIEIISNRSSNEENIRRNQPNPTILSASLPAGFSAPPPQQSPPSLPLVKSSFQEFLQYKKVAEIHDTTRRFAQLRLQQLENDHSALANVQHAQVCYSLENQNSHPVCSTSSTIFPDSQQLPNQQETTNTNTLNHLATMNSTAALHNSDNKNGTAEFLSSPEVVAITNTIKLPLTPSDLNKLASLSNLSDTAVKEVDERAAKEISKITNISSVTDDTPNDSSDHYPNSISNVSKLQNDSSVTTSATQIPFTDADNVRSTPEKERFREDIIRCSHEIQQMEHDKQSLNLITSSSQSQNHFRPSSLHSPNLHMSNQQTNQKSGKLDRFKSDKIWDTSNAEEKERTRQFWYSLSYEERRELVKIPRHVVMQTLKEEKRTNCNCLMCGKKRLVIEELESLYEAYSKNEPDKLYMNSYLSKSPNEDGISNNKDNNTNYNDISKPRAGSNETASDNDHFDFDDILTIQCGFLTITDDLLQNGGKFIDMIDLLQHRRIERQEDEAQAMAEYDVDQIGDEEEDEFTDDEDYDDYDEEGSDEDYEDEYEDVSDSEESRWDASKSLLHEFAITIFEQQLMSAYREKVAKEREEKLLEELEEEKRLGEEREAKKLRDKEKKKERKKLQKLAKEQKRMKEQMEIEKEKAATKERQRQKSEEAQRKKLDQKKKKEAEQQRQEVERLKKLEEESVKKKTLKEKERQLEEEIRSSLKEEEQKVQEKAEKLEHELELKDNQLSLEQKSKENLEQIPKQEQNLEESQFSQKEFLQIKEIQKQRQDFHTMEKELEKAETKQQHQRQILASLQKHAQETSALNDITAFGNSSSLKKPTTKTSFCEPNRFNAHVADISSFSNLSFDQSSCALDSNLAGPMAIQSSQRQNFSQQPLTDSSLCHNNNTIKLIFQNQSEFSQLSSSTNTMSPSFFEPLSCENIWNESQIMPVQNSAGYPSGSFVSSFEQTELPPNSVFTNPQQKILKSPLRSISPTENILFNTKRGYLHNPPLKPVSLNGTDSSFSSASSNPAPHSVNSPIVQIQWPYNNSNNIYRAVPSRTFSSSENLLSYNNSPTVGVATSPHFTQHCRPSTWTGPVFGSPASNGSPFSNDNGPPIDGGLNLSANQQNLSKPRSGNLWNTKNEYTCGPSSTVEQGLIDTGVASFSLASTGSVSGSSTSNFLFTGSLLDKRLNSSVVSNSVIRGAAIKAYHDYTSSFMFDGKVSCQLLYVNTLNILGKTNSSGIGFGINSTGNSVRFNQQEFVNACEQQDDQGVVHFELIRNHLDLVTHLRYRPTSFNFSLDPSISAVSDDMPVNSNHNGQTFSGSESSTGNADLKRVGKSCSNSDNNNGGSSLSASPISMGISSPHLSINSSPASLPFSNVLFTQSAFSNQENFVYLNRQYDEKALKHRQTPCPSQAMVNNSSLNTDRLKSNISQGYCVDVQKNHNVQFSQNYTRPGLHELSNIVRNGVSEDSSCGSSNLFHSSRSLVSSSSSANYLNDALPVNFHGHRNLTNSSSLYDSIKSGTC